MWPSEGLLEVQRWRASEERVLSRLDTECMGTVARGREEKRLRSRRGVWLVQGTWQGSSGTQGWGGRRQEVQTGQQARLKVEL